MEEDEEDEEEEEDEYDEEEEDYRDVGRKGLHVFLISLMFSLFYYSRLFPWSSPGTRRSEVDPRLKD